MVTEKDNILTQKGCKKTKARAAVVDILEAALQPVTAEDIYIKIKKLGLAVNLSTVYRNLDLMESKELVEKVIGGSKAMYILTGGSHKHHLICTGCRRVVSVNICPFKNMENEVVKETEFDITGHKLELYGVCPECKK